MGLVLLMNVTAGKSFLTMAGEREMGQGLVGVSGAGTGWW